LAKPIEHFCLATPVMENIGRFQVAMDDARLVGGVQSVSNLDGDVKNLSAGQWLTCDEVLESLTFQELHHDEGMAFRFINFVDGTNVGVVEGRGGRAPRAEIAPGPDGRGPAQEGET